MKFYIPFILAFFMTLSCSSLDKRVLELDDFKYPYKVTKFEFNSQNQNLQMAYMDVGAKISSKVAVLLHGKNFSGFYWKDVADLLIKDGYRVIIPDQIGFGKSTKPQAYQYSFSQFALNTSKLLSSLNIKKATVIGHSMGGMLATEFAYQFSQMTNKLILINPIGLEYYGKYAKVKDVNFFYNNEKNKTVEKARNYQKKNYYDGKWSDTYEALLAPLKLQIGTKEWDRVAWNNALHYGPIFTENMVIKLKNLSVSTTLIMGTRDRTGPGRNWKKDGVTHKLGQYQNFGKKFRDVRPSLKVIELKDLGHVPQFEDFSRFSKAFKKAI